MSEILDQTQKDEIKHQTSFHTKTEVSETPQHPLLSGPANPQLKHKQQEQKSSIKEVSQEQSRQQKMLKQGSSRETRQKASSGSQGNGNKRDLDSVNDRAESHQISDNGNLDPIRQQLKNAENSFGDEDERNDEVLDIKKSQNGPGGLKFNKQFLAS